MHEKGTIHEENDQYSNEEEVVQTVGGQLLEKENETLRVLKCL